MGDNTKRVSIGGSAKGCRIASVSHQHNPIFLTQFIDKALKILRPFVEILRIADHASDNELVMQVVKIRDVCAHKMESMTVDQLNTIASSIRWLSISVPELGDDMALSTLTIFEQLGPTFYDMKSLNRDVMVDFIYKNDAQMLDDRKVAILARLFPEKNLRGQPFFRCKEILQPTFTMTTPECAPTPAQITHLRDLYGDFKNWQC